MEFIKRIFRIFRLILIISGIIAGIISYITGIKRIENNILDIIVPDEYCIYVRYSPAVQEIFPDEAQGTECWSIKHLKLLYSTKILDVGRHKFVEPKKGFEYYYNARISSFLGWYAGFSFFMTLILSRTYSVKK